MRERVRGKGIEWRDVSTPCYDLTVDSHDVSLVKNIIVNMGSLGTRVPAQTLSTHFTLKTDIQLIQIIDQVV